MSRLSSCRMMFTLGFFFFFFYIPCSFFDFFFLCTLIRFCQEEDIYEILFLFPLIWIIDIYMNYWFSILFLFQEVREMFLVFLKVHVYFRINELRQVDLIFCNYMLNSILILLHLYLKIYLRTLRLLSNATN